VAVIGASSDPTKLGYSLARNLVQSNYQGVVHFVNPKGGRMFGQPLHASILEVPDPLDLAIILIPAPAVLPALVDCGQRGVGAVIIASGGFRETGAAGAALEVEALQITRRFGMRLVGPNSIGWLDTHLPIDATFLPPPGPLPGDVAFISHSGAICAAVIDWARGQSFGLSRLVSLGNQADVNETDVLAPVAADPFTRVLTLYLEGVSDGRRFVSEASQVTRRKPVIALKVGRYAGGQRAVISHTGALAGQERAYQAAFRRAGVIRAETSEELFDWARALAWCPLPEGRRIAVLTNAGGPGVTAADALEANGMQLAGLAVETCQALQAILPPAASLGNPVDMLASASPEQYAACLRLLLADPGVDGGLVILPPPPLYTAGAVAKALIPVIHAALKPVVVALMGERLIQEAVEHFRAARVPEYRFTERAASALATLAERAEYLGRLAVQDSEPALPARAVDAGMIADLHAQLARLPYNPNEVALPTEMVEQLLQAYHIPVLPSVIAHSAQEAVRLAGEIGFPVAIKLVSPAVSHKSDVKGVILNITDEAEAEASFLELKIRLQAAVPGAEFRGVTVQRMAQPGQEVILGVVQDDQFGPLVMFGAGGVEVEGQQDVAFCLAPLTRGDAQYLFENTWAGRKLNGYRNLPPADRAAVREALLGLGRLAVEFPELAEIEINPLRVLAPGQGVASLDVRACRTKPEA
jgi:acetyltransferase